MAYLGVFLWGGSGKGGGVSNEHPETGLEGSDFCFSVIRGDVIYGYSTVTTQTGAHKLWDAFVGAVTGAEEKHSGPVVGEVVREGAAGAGGFGGEVVGSWVHGGVKGVTTNDLVKVRGWDGAWRDKRVETVDYQLRALEAHHGHAGYLTDNWLCESQAHGEEALQAHVGWMMHWWPYSMLSFLARGTCEETA